MMNASENLNAAGILVEERPENGNVHASSIMQLCRSAMESSSRTIWLLSEPDREVRRDRCLSLLMEQLVQQKRFLKIDDENVNGGPNPPPAHIVAMNRAHRQKQADLVQRLRDSYTISKTETFSKTIALAAEWVDAHLPAHDSGEAQNYVDTGLFEQVFGRK
jgi:hypothetical protein